MAQGLPPGIFGYQAGVDANQRQQAGQLQQLGILSQLYAQQEAQAQAREDRPLRQQILQGQVAKTLADQQREQQFRGALSALGPNPSPGALAQIAAQFSSPDKVLDIGQRAADRQVTQEGQLAIGRERMAATQEAQAARAIEARERQQAGFDQQRSMAQLAAGLRQPRQEPAPTAVTIQDPDDPNGTLIIDARTNRKIGKGPKLTDAGKLENKRQFAMQGIGQAIQEAENLLTGKSGKALPTGSGAGAVIDYATSLIGVSPSGAAEAQTMKAIGGALVAKMPRMEGPQSDKDLNLYKEMAGVVGENTIPRERRIAALEKVKELWTKYERLNPGVFSDRRDSDEPPPGAVRPRR